MTDPRPDLRLVDRETGELIPECVHCAESADQLAGAEHEVRAWRARYAALKRDKAKEAKVHKLYPVAVECFRHWQQRCNHPRSKFTPDRFWTLEPFISTHGLEMCKRAIDGAAYDPFVTRRKNGSSKRHDGLELVFRDEGKFEEFCNRAPRPTEEDESK